MTRHRLTTADRRAGAHTANAHRRVQANCVDGHPFDHVNTYVTRDNRRQCRRCRAESMAVKRRALRSLAVLAAAIALVALLIAVVMS